MLKRSWVVCMVAGLVACGGGGGGSKLDAYDDDWRPGVYKPAEDFINQCENPRSGRSPHTNQRYPDRQGSYRDENNFLRSWSNDTYLWYLELPDLNPASYRDTLEYFDKLKTDAITSTGAEKDRFHFTYDSDDWEALSGSGISYGYGMELVFVRNTPPRELRVAYTQPGSPAALAGVVRGSQIVQVDGVDLVNTNSDAGIDTLNAGLFPDAQGEAHSFRLELPGGGSQDLVLQSAQVTSVPVQQVKTIQTDSGKVGYFAFHDHIAPAELQLRDAVAQLQGESISDLIIDLRYNGGGYLAIASQLAYMIAGSSATQGKTFELMQFNDKHRTYNPITGERLGPDPFYDTGLGFSLSAGMALPALNLERVFVLAGNDTCSASEALINGLRGVDVEVILIGETTCGKPYGFYAQPNCGTTYFTVQFRGVNAKNFGDYSDGFVPSGSDNGLSRVRGCQVADDYLHALGDANEARLAAALYYRANGSCPATSLAQASQKPAATAGRARLVKPEALRNAWGGRP